AAAKAAAAEKRRVRKALAQPPVVKKKKVMCASCGAKQNPKHVHCPECGHMLAGAMPVTKNHDFACLGCGKDPLDKGEQYCPQCGKENPGYLPEADHKIPANKVAAKESVSKKRKAKGSKGDNPFGDKKAPPFGAKDDDDSGDAKPAKKAEKRKGKGKGRSPAAGVTGHDGDTKGLPAHREPDGAPVEEFEKDANMSDGDEHQEMAAAMRHKALAARGLSREDALLHDLTCPAFDPADVRKCFPYASLGDINDAAWQQQALVKAASAPPEVAFAMRDLFRHAETLKNAPPDILAELRQQAHLDFLAANKVITDATPGPASFPTPGHVTPQQFQRPYISAGHGAESPQAGPPHSFSVPEGQPSAEDYTRPFITEGRAADSPANDTPRHEPIPAPMTPGMPSRVYYTGAMRDNARQAMTAMHDHISRVFPDVCPMGADVSAIQKPAPQVPNGVGGPAPRSGKSAGKAAKAKARKQRKALAAKRRRLERKVLKGEMTVKQARKRLGLKPAVTKAAKPAPVTKAAAAAQPVLDPEVIKTVIAEANAPLLERIAAQDKTLRKQRKAIAAIASQPDTSQAPLRGVAMVHKSSAAPAVPQTASATAERVQLAELQRLHYQSRNSPDPAMREASRRDLETKLGLDSMNTQT
ncbi:MAG TPA: zinc ribbon domain-containing protein, partial [Gemmataceae bacterium]|nr:zinc ribbon domain-containing protein [Gemmataceae bacterium]